MCSPVVHGTPRNAHTLWAMLAAAGLAALQAQAATETLNAVTGNGAYAQWTASAGSNRGLDNAASDGIASYYTGSQRNRILSVPMADATVAAVNRIDSVVVRAQVRSLATLTGTTQGLAMQVRIGATNYANGVVCETTPAYAYFQRTWVNSPATNARWTWAEVNGLQAGVRTVRVSGNVVSTTYYSNHIQMVVYYTLNQAPAATGVAANGTITVGQTLTGAYTYSDPDGDAQGASTYRWYRSDDAAGTNRTAIAGATATTYVLSVASEGKYVSFEVTPVATVGPSPGTPVESLRRGPVAPRPGSAPVASAVSIAGDPTVGGTLTGNYTYSDADADLEGTSTFRWLRGGVPIVGATAATYLIVLADEGASIVFEVTPVAATGTPKTGGAAQSAAVGPVAPATGVAPVASNVAVGGTVTVGQTLTGTYTYSDGDGDLEGASTFRWLRGGSTIAGATSATYALVVADEGASISFEVSPVAATGAPKSGAPVLSSVVGPVAPQPGSAPVAGSVSVSGTATVGQTLSGSYAYSDADGDLEGVTTMRWLRSGSPIAGATGATYVLSVADEGALVAFEVTPVALTGTPKTGTATVSAAVGPVAALAGSAPEAANVGVDGAPTVGEVLTGTYTYFDADGDLEAASTYRWLRNGTPIAGATALTYALVLADEGANIVFEVTPVAATGLPKTGTAVQSAAVGPVAPATGVAPVASDVAVSGNARVDDTLHGSFTYSDDDGDAEGTSMFRWLRDGVAISGATDSLYVLTPADVGAMVSFEVTPVALTGTPKAGTAVASTPVGPVDAMVDLRALAARRRPDPAVRVHVFDLLGRSARSADVMRRSAAASAGSRTLGLAPGTYLMRVTSSGHGEADARTRKAGLAR